MATKNMAYDNAAYLARLPAPMGEIGGAAATAYAKFAAFTGMIAYSAQFTVTTAGTAASALTVNKISGTATTSIGTVTPGTSAAGTTFNALLGDTSLLQGDILEVVSGADIVGKVAVSYEVGLSPGASVTA